MNAVRFLALAAPIVLLAACSGQPDAPVYGAEPPLPDPQRGLLPSMLIAKPAEWGDRRPTVPEGYTVTAIATELQIPRQTLVLPNGDILVAEGKGGGAPALTPKDVIATVIKAKGTSSVKGGNRLTLLRDADGDGVYESKTVFASGLNAPYGLALIENRLYVANQDALVRFDYQPGQFTAAGPPVKVTDLPSAINHHWTKALTASADGRFLYVGIGSNSNITERGMPAEVDRAMVWEIDAKTGAHRPYATGLRNPTALTVQPGSGRVWVSVNERDELGPNLVPDYVTSVREGGFYGWPYSYWGQNVDTRVRPQDPDKVAAALKPDYALGAHVATLGLAFSTAAMGAPFAEGLFVGEHGSWNRSPPSGYKVVFVPFRDGRPAGPAVDVVTGFLGEDGKTRGRPVGVTVDPRGALLVADDLSNTLWRIAPTARPTAAGTATPVAGAASAPLSTATSATTGPSAGAGASAAGANAGTPATAGASDAASAAPVRQARDPRGAQGPLDLRGRRDPDGSMRTPGRVSVTTVAMAAMAPPGRRRSRSAAARGRTRRARARSSSPAR